MRFVLFFVDFIKKHVNFCKISSYNIPWKINKYAEKDFI